MNTTEHLELKTAEKSKYGRIKQSLTFLQTLIARLISRIGTETIRVMKYFFGKISLRVNLCTFVPIIRRMQRISSIANQKPRIAVVNQDSLGGNLIDYKILNSTFVLSSDLQQICILNGKTFAAVFAD